MSVLELRQLHKLHLIDLAIFQIKQKAAALDPGRQIQAEMAVLKADLDAKTETYKGLQQQSADLELKIKSYEAKLKKANSDLYGGSTVNARDAENLAKDIAMVTKHKDDTEFEELELLDQIPAAKALFEEATKQMAAKQNELREHQKKAMEMRTKLEETFKEAMAQRPVAAAEVPKHMLDRYEIIRKSKGIGMTDVVKGKCEQCGMVLPVKAIVAAKEGKMIACEACHRLIYATDGLI